jgi:hypothetical protein
MSNQEDIAWLIKVGQVKETPSKPQTKKEEE